MKWQQVFFLIICVVFKNVNKKGHFSNLRGGGGGGVPATLERPVDPPQTRSFSVVYRYRHGPTFKNGITLSETVSGNLPEYQYWLRPSWTLMTLRKLPNLTAVFIETDQNIKTLINGDRH